MNGTAQRRGLLRDRLVGLAEATIATEGLPALRARDLAQAAGCSVGAIYTAVPDLDALVLLVNARTLDAMEAAFPSDPALTAAGALLAAGDAYLDYAARHRQRWDALFSHRLPPGRAVPDWYAARLAAMFVRVEAPLARLKPHWPGTAHSALARTLFSAVHGVVVLGLDEKVGPIGSAALRGQVRLLVGTLTAGLTGETDWPGAVPVP